MTREEAIDCNKNLRMYMRLSDKNQPYKFLEENYIALDMAIEALKQEDIFDKIRAEIKETYLNITYQENKNRKATWGLRKALEIIDKCRAESEG